MSIAIDPTPVAEARAVLAHHGRSFHWASRLLGQSHAERCALLYAFCRHVDDLVDEGDPGQAAHALSALRWSLARTEDPSGMPDAVRRLGIEPDVARAFVDGVASDLGPVRVADVEGLVRYAYGVAGTVGLMMCSALEVSEPQALPFAVDLGIGMQLTNIARDVLEDAERGRVYLPATWVGQRCTAAAIAGGDPDARLAAWAAVDRLIALAECYYRSADRGMRYLPTRARAGILTASRVYESIGTEIRRRGPERYWARRTVVSNAGKLWQTFRALVYFAGTLPTSRAQVRPAHDQRLHFALGSAPGADRAA